MTYLSNLNTVSQSSSTPANASSILSSPANTHANELKNPAASFTPAESASTLVALSSASLQTSLTYAALNQPESIAHGQTWANRSDDKVSALMARNVAAGNTSSSRFTGLGSALLGRFKAGSDNFSQTVVNYLASSHDQKSVDKASQTELGVLQSAPLDKISLGVQTRSGKTVELVLSRSATGLGVEVKSSSKLTQAERNALSQLASGFEKATQGVTGIPPRVDIAGLAGYDTKVLSSVDFKSSGSGTLALEFHADATQRSLKAALPTGKVELSVNLSNPATWGSQAQREKAIGSYLAQVDKAASRGNADRDLINLFKASFAAIHTSYPTSNTGTSRLADQDQAMLTGLADFQTHIRAEPVKPNPLHLEEVDAFNYQTSQTTRLSGRNNANRAIIQQQEAKLNASFHQGLSSAKPPILTDQKESQNYRYYQIEDQASSKTSISYRNGLLDKASVEKTARQSTHIKQYEMGNLTEERDNPLSRSDSQDFSATLNDLKTKQIRGLIDQFDRQYALNALNEQLFLESSPADLQAPASSRNIRAFS